MKTRAEWAPAPNVRISEVERVDGGWTVSATLMDGGRCPACDAKSTQRHGCQAPSWCENLKIFSAISINSENFVLQNSHY